MKKGLVDDDEDIAPSMLYAWACLKEGVPFINGAPNLSCDIPALRELSKQTGAPIAGKDFKTGQTFLKNSAGTCVEGAPPGAEWVVLDEHPG